MKTSFANLAGFSAIASFCIMAGAAAACPKGGGYGGGHGGYYGGSKYGTVVVQRAYLAPSYATCYRPFHSDCYVLAGDTWYTICQREYGNSSYGQFVASYNSLSMSSPLSIGQQLRLPEIYSNGRLAASSAPAASPLAMTNASARQLAPAQAAPAVPAANIRQASESTLPNVPVGSVLVLDAASLGSEKGLVRLRLNGVALPVDVLDWSGDSAKVRLPEMDLASAIEAEIEVLRADGSLASKSAVQLTPSDTRLARGN
jgi:hypothetical protein